jgi:2-iminobutanoate/2-iminopropanoate deaminase
LRRTRRAATMAAMRNSLSTPDAPKAIGPYSQGVVASGARTLFLSGQIPLDPRTGELVSGSIEDQTRRVMENLRAVLAAGGAGFEHVVKTTIFLADLGDFAKVNEVYGGYFQETPPARANVQVAALPRGARVEIDAIAVVD